VRESEPRARASTPAELDASVEATLRERLGADVAVTSITRRRSEHSSSYATEVITVRLVNRKPLRLFLKDFAVAAWQKDLMPERRAREVAVYRELLDGAGLGTPEYFGAVWDEERGRFWLLLEHVDGPQVKWCEFEEWLRAAAWLGVLHGRFARAERRLAGAAFLARHDVAFFQTTAELARRAVSLRAPALAARLDGALSGYGELVDEMAALPRTLVHGGYRPQNIIRGVSGRRPRICPADWEEASYGSLFYDFAYLSDGFDPERLALLWAAYRDAATRAHVAPPPDSAALRLVRAFNVHKNLGTLAKADDREFPADAVDKLVGMVEASAVAAHG
jgi:Phosphotransferase enzyme family